MTESTTAESTSPPRGALRGWVLASSFALLFAVSFPPFGWWPVIVLAPIPLAVLATTANRRRDWLLPVFLSATILWTWFHWWIIEVSVAGVVPLALYLACFTTAATWFLRVLSRGSPRFPLWLTVPVVLTGVDFFRASIVLDGYPWYLFFQPWIDLLPVASLAWWGGGWLVGIWGGVLSGLVAEWWCRRSTRPMRFAELAMSLLGVGLVVVLLSIWNARHRTAPVEPGASLSVLAIQTNLPTDNKIGWTMERKLEDVPAFVDQTIAGIEAAGGPERVDLVVWPETMLPTVGFEFGDQFSRAIEAVVDRLQVPMLVGAPCYLGIRADDSQGWIWDQHFNSAYLITPDGPPYDRVDKVFLTPFGETMPVISNWAWLEQQLLAIGAAGMRFDLDAGEEIVRLEVPGRAPGGVGEAPVRLAVPICFEDTVSHVIHDMVWVDGRRVADLLINISNDGWFAGDDAGRAMHELCARWTALSNFTPMLRVANTGRTALISSRGRLDDPRGPMRASWSHLFTVRAPGRWTPAYAWVGAGFGWFSLAGLVLSLLGKWCYTWNLTRSAR
ncbi:MAG: apolipoprotein N-acyltransferase [Planctomycetota bacterium]|nr:apolipoprotein N-acyltransferase [Planctomycetota bacterium]